MKQVKFNFSRFGAVLGITCAIILPLLQTSSSLTTAGANDRTAKVSLVAPGTVSNAVHAISAGLTDLPQHIGDFITAHWRRSRTDGQNMLSKNDAEYYKGLFAAVRKGDDASIAKLTGKIRDRGLLGTVLAERYSRANCCVNYGQLNEWLRHYNSLPQAMAIYARALNLRQDSDPIPYKPTAASPVRANFDEQAPSFTALVPLTYDAITLRADEKNFAQQVNALIRKTRPTQAQKLLETTLRQRKLAPEFEAHARAAIAASFYFEGTLEKSSALLEAKGKPTPLAQWIGGLIAWRQQDYARADNLFTALAARQNIFTWDKAAANFWAARARTKLGDRDGAEAMLEAAADLPRTFYGMLATQALGQDIDRSWDLPRLSSRHLRALSNTDAGWRALALLQIGEKDLAEAELRRLRPGNNDTLQEALLAVTHNAGMPALLMQLGGSIRPDKDKFYDAALYPVPPWQPAQGFAGDQALLYAVMRHESRFETDAKSHRGARGLMQLMPNTANVMAGGVLHTNISQLSDPVINLSLGQRYVGHLASQPAISNNLLLLLTAYNSGPANMKRWLRDLQTGDDPLLFIESLPVRETRDYTEHVLANYWMYRAQLDQPLTSLAELANGKWPRAHFMPAVIRKAATKFDPGIQLASQTR